MTYVILVIGPSKKPFPRFLQIAGILASLLSVSNTTAEGFLFTDFNSAYDNKDICNEDNVANSHKRDCDWSKQEDHQLLQPRGEIKESAKST